MNGRLLRTTALCLAFACRAAMAQEVTVTSDELEPGATAPTVNSTSPDQGVTTALVPTIAQSAASLHQGDQWLANRTGGVPVTHVTNPTGTNVFVPMGSAAELASAITVLPTHAISIVQGCPPQTVAACGQSIDVAYGNVGWTNAVALAPSGSATVVCSDTGNWTIAASNCPVVAPPAPPVVVPVSAPVPPTPIQQGRIATGNSPACTSAAQLNFSSQISKTNATLASSQCEALCAAQDVQWCVFMDRSVTPEGMFGGGGVVTMFPVASDKCIGLGVSGGTCSWTGNVSISSIYSDNYYWRFR